jgi:hypothetical protein
VASAFIVNTGRVAYFQRTLPVLAQMTTKGIGMQHGAEKFSAQDMRSQDMRSYVSRMQPRMLVSRLMAAFLLAYEHARPGYMSDSRLSWWPVHPSFDASLLVFFLGVFTVPGPF